MSKSLSSHEKIVSTDNSGIPLFFRLDSIYKLLTKVFLPCFYLDGVPKIITNSDDFPLMVYKNFATV